MTMYVTLWHNPKHKKSNMNAKAGIYLQSTINTNDDIRIYELPDCTTASVIHANSYQRLPKTYDALLH